jgi:hypothetical protein
VCAQRIFDHEKLARAITTAASEKTAAAVGRMLVGRRGGRVAYIVTVAPLGTELAVYERPLAMIFVADPDARTPSEPPRETLLDSLACHRQRAGSRRRSWRGKNCVRLPQIPEFRSRPFRPQLSSVLRKVGVSRQTELIRVLSNIPVVPASLPEGK